MNVSRYSGELTAHGAMLYNSEHDQVKKPIEVEIIDETDALVI